MGEEKDQTLTVQIPQSRGPKAGDELSDAALELQFEAYRNLIHQLRSRALVSAPSAKH